MLFSAWARRDGTAVDIHMYAVLLWIFFLLNKYLGLKILGLCNFTALEELVQLSSNALSSCISSQLFLTMGLKELREKERA